MAGTKPPPAPSPTGPTTALHTRMVVSALGGMGAATFCHPIDVVRIQMQLFKFNGTIDAVRRIVERAGARALYNGITARHALAIAIALYTTTQGRVILWRKCTVIRRQLLAGIMQYRSAPYTLEWELQKLPLLMSLIGGALLPVCVCVCVCGCCRLRTSASGREWVKYYVDRCPLGTAVHCLHRKQFHSFVKLCESSGDLWRPLTDREPCATPCLID